MSRSRLIPPVTYSPAPLGSAAAHHIRSPPDWGSPIDFAAKSFSLLDLSPILSLYSHKEVAVRLAWARSIRRLLETLKLKGDANALIAGLRALLVDSDLAVRLEAVELCAYMAPWAEQVLLLLREHYKDHAAQQAVAHTLLYGYGKLGAHIEGQNLQAVLIFLTRLMVDASQLTRGVAFEQIARIASERKMSVQRLFDQFGSVVYPQLLLDVHNKAPVVASVIQALFDRDLDSFVKACLPSALPQLVLIMAHKPELANSGLLAALAKRAGVEVPALLLQQLADVLAHAMGGANEDVAAVMPFLATVMGATVKDLLLVSQERLLFLLVMMMGRPENGAKAKGRRSISNFVNSFKDNAGRKQDEAELVSSQLLFITHSLKAIFTRAFSTPPPPHPRLTFFRAHR